MVIEEGQGAFTKTMFMNKDHFLPNVIVIFIVSVNLYFSYKIKFMTSRGSIPGSKHVNTYSAWFFQPTSGRVQQFFLSKL